MDTFKSQNPKSLNDINNLKLLKLSFCQNQAEWLFHALKQNFSFNPSTGELFTDRNFDSVGGIEGV